MHDKLLLVLGMVVFMQSFVYFRGLMWIIMWMYNGLVCRCSIYHSDLQGFDVELPNLPVAQDIAKDFHKSIDPEDGCHDEKKNNPAVLLDAEWRQKTFSEAVGLVCLRN